MTLRSSHPRLVLMVLVVLMVLAVWSQSLWADELSDMKARNAQLETTVQELTLQLAEALKRQRELEAALASARSVTSPPVSMDSDDNGSDDGDVMVDEVIDSSISRPAAAGEEGVAVEDGACNVSQALAAYSGSGDDNRALSAWLEDTDRLNACSDEQLLRLRDAVKWDWLGYQKAVLGRIDEELKSR